MGALSELYAKDYTAWAKQTAELIKAGRFSEVDTEHLLEELEGMGTSERNELDNRLIALLSHLLKWQYQYKQLADRWAEFEGRSWEKTIIQQRVRLARRLRKSPGLKPIVEEMIQDVYQDAVISAAKETGLPISTFPESCPYSQAQILDDDFYPPQQGE